MPQEIDWDQFSVFAFIDSNVALECLALEQLPWTELDRKGPILVLVVPAVAQEVDSKKSHARLGNHARRFNKTLRELLKGNSTVVVRESPDPRVEVAMAPCRVDWANYPELDREEPDAKVIAQVLSATCPDDGRRIIVSHDIYPLHLAQSYGLKTHLVGDSWLRPKETSEADKKVASLQKELTAMKSREPVLELAFEPSQTVVDTFQIKDLSDELRREIEETIIRLNPLTVQKPKHQSVFSFGDDYDYTLEERYKKWEEKIIPEFVRQYERKLELNFGQVEILFRIKNTGRVPAESLLIRLSVNGGWLNDTYVLASPAGPFAPRPRDRSHSLSHTFIPRNITPPGKHEFHVLEEPKRSLEVQIACEDFRHGYEHEYRLIAWVDPHADAFELEAVVTASNLHGEVTERLQLSKNVQQVGVEDLIDLETLKFLKLPELALLYQDAIKKGDFTKFGFDGAGWDK